MSNIPRRGKRGPAPSWQLGSTRAIRVPIVLADVLLNLARQIDNGEVSLVDTYITKSDQQKVSPVLEVHSAEQKNTTPEKTATKRNLATMRAEAQAIYAQAQANFAQAEAYFAQAQNNLFRNNIKQEK